MWYILLQLIRCTQSAPALSPFLIGNDAYLTKEYINAITAYGPGLGVFTPYSYVDLSYDNIPFVGKIPVLGKEGTSSKLGISPFYPPQGNPSNPFPPLYRARPLPLHVPEPQDVVAVPLDEEALHGEPLFPPELVLPWEPKPKVEEGTVEKPTDPFGDTSELAEQSYDRRKSDIDFDIMVIQEDELERESDVRVSTKLGLYGGAEEFCESGLVAWPTEKLDSFPEELPEVKSEKEDVTIRVDKVAERNVKEE